MSKYLLIESRDPFESNDVAHHYELAANLARDGNEVTVFLVQNGVLPARSKAVASGLADLAGAGVTVLADDFSLRERGIGENQLASGVRAAALDTVVDGMADGAKTLWH